jgi:hypothetical protein
VCDDAVIIAKLFLQYVPRLPTNNSLCACPWSEMDRYQAVGSSKHFERFCSAQSIIRCRDSSLVEFRSKVSFAQTLKYVRSRGSLACLDFFVLLLFLCEGPVAVTWYNAYYRYCLLRMASTGAIGHTGCFRAARALVAPLGI